MVRVITVARKPCALSATANARETGAGALNIDASRIGKGDGGMRDVEESRARRYTNAGSTNFAATPGPRGGDARGRWPTNIFVLGSEMCESLARQSDGGSLLFYRHFEVE